MNGQQHKVRMVSKESEAKFSQNDRELLKAVAKQSLSLEAKVRT